MPPASAGPWWVYVIRSTNGALYTGITTDLIRRLTEHRAGRRGARFFRFAGPRDVLYTESVANRAAAARREAAIKALSRSAKLALIRAARPSSRP
jgi:putative endonuclease